MPNDPPQNEAVLAGDKVVFRLARIHDKFPHESQKPLAIHFKLHPNDFQRGRWSLTVWDLSRTSPDDAAAMMQQSGDRRAFCLRVNEIHQIALKDDPHALWVVREIDSTDAQRGAHGHCGILGLQREIKDDERALRDKLVEKAHRCDQSVIASLSAT